MERQETLAAGFNKGMYMDADPNNFPEGYYSFAMNYVSKDSSQMMIGSNEHANKKIADTANKIAGKIYQEEFDRSFFILRDQSIWMQTHKDETLKKVCEASEFNCEWEILNCEFVHVEVYTKGCDTYVQFSANWVYYSINISQMLDPKRKAALISEIIDPDCKTCNKSCDYFRVFKPKCRPSIKAKAYQKGGSLSAGAYVYNARLINSDGATTAWSYGTRKQFIYSEHNEPGEPSRGRVEIEFNNLNCLYDQIEIAVTYFTRDSVVTRVLAPRYFNSSFFSFTHTHALEGQAISTSEILSLGGLNLEGRFQKHYNGSMNYYGIKPTQEYNVQTIANNVRVLFYAEKYPLSLMKKHQIQSLPRGESVAFGLWVNHDDGTASYAGAIPFQGGSVTPQTPPETSVDNSGTGSGFTEFDPGKFLEGFPSEEAKQKHINALSNPITAFSEKGTNSKDPLLAMIQIYNVTCEELQCIEQGSTYLDVLGDRACRAMVEVPPVGYYLDVKYQTFIPTSCIGLPPDGSELAVVIKDKKLQCQSQSSPITQGSGGSISSSGGGSTNCYSITQELEFNRKRDGGKETVRNPLNGDKLLQIEQALVESYQTDILDIEDNFRPVLPPDGCALDTDDDDNNNETTETTSTTTTRDASGNIVETSETVSEEPIPQVDINFPPDELNCFANVKDRHKQADLLDKDIRTAEDIAVKWASILGDLIGDKGKKDLIKLFRPSNIKEASTQILTSIRNREEIEILGQKYDVTNSQTYVNSSNDKKHFNEEDREKEDEAIKLPPTAYPGGTFEGYFYPEPAPERDTKYPCTKDCEGNPIYGSLANTPVINFKIPDESKIPHYISHSVGVPSKVTPEADEYADGYGIVIGAEFSGIDFDPEHYYKVTGKRVCKVKPITIGQIKLTDLNKTILTKGLGLDGFRSRLFQKEYIYPKIGTNSFERCSKYINIDDFRHDPGAPNDPNTQLIYSLDQAALEPYIGSATNLKTYFKLSGSGYRHSLYAHGRDPENKMNGRKIDLKGAISSVNLSGRTATYADSEINFSKYVGANLTEAPSSGGETPLCNQYGQPCLWVHANSVQTNTDKSFVGDVLTYAAPVESAIGNYVVLTRELNNQYGAIENRSYIPKLTGKGPVMRGLIGNRFISPYSFFKTSFVSDKVGDYFQIENMDSSKEDRCICDAPDDALNEYVGKYVWTQLPKEGDVSDAKNWCGLHTVGGRSGTRTRPWPEANAQTATESDMYYPGTHTQLITYWGEWEVNPWGVEIADTLEKQRYPFLRPTYHLGSSTPESHDWNDSWLDQALSLRVKQPSYAERLMKVILKSLIGLVLPYLGITDLLSPENIGEMLGDITQAPMIVVIFMLFNKVLFTNDFIDEFIGLEKCKTQEEGGIEFTIASFFTNYNEYSSVYNDEMSLVSVTAIKEMTNCCSDLDSYPNYIYKSDIQLENSPYNGYYNVRANNFFILNNNRGKLTSLQEIGGRLYAFLTDGIAILQSPNHNGNETAGDFTSGTGNIFQPHFVTSSNPEGSSGLQNRHHLINTPFGIFFIDYKSSIFYSFDGQQARPLSYNGAYNFFKKYTKYCNDSDCIDEQQGQHFALGYDPALQRILITKVDGDASWTISYDPIGNEGKGSWLSFHNYIPTNYHSTRDRIYHLQEDAIYLHSPYDHDNLYGEFFGFKYPTVIDTIISKDYRYFKSLSLNTEVREVKDEGTRYNLDETVDYVGYHTSRQTAGIHQVYPLLTKDKHSINKNQDYNNSIIATKYQNLWNINELHDYTIDYKSNLEQLLEPCLPYTTFTNYADFSERAIQNYKDRRIADNWHKFRLIFLNSEEYKKIYFKSLYLLTDKKPK